MASAEVSVNLSALSVKELLVEYDRMIAAAFRHYPENRNPEARELLLQVEREIVARCQTHYDPPQSLAMPVDYGVHVYTIDFRMRSVTRSMANSTLENLDDNSKAAGLYCPE